MLSLCNQVILAVYKLYINAYFKIKNIKSFIDKSPESEFLQISQIYHNWTLIFHHKNFLISKQKKIEGCGLHRIEDDFK